MTSPVTPQNPYRVLPPVRRNSKLDYRVNWTEALAKVEDTIASNAWTVPAEVQKVNNSQDGAIATAWLRPVKAGRFTIEHTVTTAAGRVATWGFILDVF